MQPKDLLWRPCFLKGNMRSVKFNKQTNLIKKIILALFLIILILLILMFFKSDFFKVHLVDISLNKINCADQKTIKEKSEVLNKNIFLLDGKKINDNLKNKFICIQDVKLEKNLPSKIKLDIQGREAVAQLLSISGFEASASSLIENTATPSALQITDTSLVDSEGVIFSKETSLSQPKIYIYGGKLEDEYLIKTLSILKALRDLQLDNTIVYVFNHLLVTQSKPKIIFRLDGEKNIQIASLQLILQKAKIDDKELEVVDLRFDKPIVRFAPKKK